VSILQLPDATSPNVYFQATIAAGSAWDPVGKEGLAQMVAKGLIDAGAGDRSSIEVRDALYPTGNGFDLVVDREWVNLRLRCHSDHQSLCAEMFIDALTRPRFDAADIDRGLEEQTYAVGDGLLSDEEALGEEAINALIYSAHPYGHPVAGRTGALRALTADSARTFYSTHYVRSAVHAGIAGSWTPDTLAILEAGLATLSGTMPPELLLQQPEQFQGRQLLLVDTDTEVTGVHFGHPIELTRDHPDYPAMTVAMTALGAHRQSFGRLFRIVRTARGLNYGTYAYIEQYIQRGWSSLPEQGVGRSQNHFYTWIRPTSTDNGPFALRLAVAEVERLVADGLEPAEFEDIRAYLQGWTPLLAQEPGRQLAFALDAQVMNAPNFLEIGARIDALSVEQVNEAIKRHIQADNLKIVMVTGDAEGTRARLLEETETPIVYRDVSPNAEQVARDAEVAAWPLALTEDQVWIKDAQGLFR
jgi:zinc protease